MQYLGQTVYTFYTFSAFKNFMQQLSAVWQNVVSFSTFQLYAPFINFFHFLGSYELVQVKKVSCRFTNVFLVPYSQLMFVVWWHVCITWASTRHLKMEYGAHTIPSTSNSHLSSPLKSPSCNYCDQKMGKAMSKPSRNDTVG
jgi:hypothetical protein